MQVGSTWRKHRAVRVIKAKPRWVAARMEPRGRDRHRWANPRGRSGREHMSQSGDANRISIDESRRSSVPRQEQAPIATSTPQRQQAITEALEKVITAINQADLAEKEKNEAKSLLRKLLRSKAAAKVLGPCAQSLAAKYFTE